MSYGKELVLDLHDCDVSKFTRKDIRQFFIELCDLIDMERCDLHFWDYEGDEAGYEAAEDHLKGISAIQFITTSNITIHTLDVLKTVYLNIFSCKQFDPNIPALFCANWFGGTIVTQETIKRL